MSGCKKLNIQNCEINYVPEITDSLKYWPMLEIFGGKTLEAYYFPERKQQAVSEE